MATLSRGGWNRPVAVRSNGRSALRSRPGVGCGVYTGALVLRSQTGVAGSRTSPLDYDLTDEDLAGIVQKVRIEGPYGQETSQPVPPGVPGEAPPEKTDTGIFGQTIARPATGKTQGELGLELEPTEREPVKIKPILASEVAKLAQRGGWDRPRSTSPQRPTRVGAGDAFGYTLSGGITYARDILTRTHARRPRHPVQSRSL